MLKFIGLVLVSVAATGCATGYAGSAHVSGRTACEAKCKEQGMALSGMVFMGDYTSGCVCTMPGQAASAHQHIVAIAEAAAAAGGTGVTYERKREERAQDRHLTSW
jgi:hypothetical protein